MSGSTVAGGRSRRLPARAVRAAGLVTSLAYGALIVWVYAHQPQTIAEVSGGLASSVGAYRADPAALAEGLRYFHNDQFIEARLAFDRADPARRDPIVQFYVAYSFYREGWGRVYSDDALYRKGVEEVDRAIASAPDGRVAVDDPQLKLHSSDELKAELERGLTRGASDFNPLKVFRERK
jgi:hypothetical protein